MSSEVHKLSKERQKQLDCAGQLIAKGVNDCTSIIAKSAFEILECVRQAAQGNAAKLMDFAFRITPAHLREPKAGIPTVPRELQMALTNIIPPATENIEL